MYECISLFHECDGLVKESCEVGAPGIVFESNFFIIEFGGEMFFLFAGGDKNLCYSGFLEEFQVGGIGTISEPDVIADLI